MSPTPKPPKPPTATAERADAPRRHDTGVAEAAWLARPLASPGEFERLRALVRGAWRDHGPIHYSAPGALDWWRGRNVGADLATQATLWFRPGSADLAGWSWSQGDELDWFVRLELPPADELDLRATMIDRHKRLRLDAGETTWGVFVAQGTLEMEAAVAAGASPSGESFVELLTELQRDPPRTIEPPADYHIRPVRLPEERAARVEVHRAAFARSRFTLGWYASLAEPGSPYDPTLDLVAVAPDGSFAGFTIGWLDGVAAVGEIEPLGTHPDHRGRGIARALASALLVAFARRGARYAIVYCESENAPALAAYQAAGFRQAGTSHLYRGSVEQYRRAR